MTFLGRVSLDVQINCFPNEELYDVNVYVSGTDEHVDELEQSFPSKQDADKYVSELKAKYQVKEVM